MKPNLSFSLLQDGAAASARARVRFEGSPQELQQP